MTCSWQEVNWLCFWSWNSNVGNRRTQTQLGWLPAKENRTETRRVSAWSVLLVGDAFFYEFVPTQYTLRSRKESRKSSEKILVPKKVILCSICVPSSLVLVTRLSLRNVSRNKILATSWYNDTTHPVWSCGMGGGDGIEAELFAAQIYRSLRAALAEFVIKWSSIGRRNEKKPALW